MEYLLDTNVCIVHLRSRGAGGLSRRMREVHPSRASLCSMVRAELLSGALRSHDSVKNLNKVNEFIGLFSSWPFDDKAAEEYAKIRAGLEASGSLIGGNDIIIASIALANHLTLVTHNTREFNRVPDLKLEDWEI